MAGGFGSNAPTPAQTALHRLARKTWRPSQQRQQEQLLHPPTIELVAEQGLPQTALIKPPPQRWLAGRSAPPFSTDQESLVRLVEAEQTATRDLWKRASAFLEFLQMNHPTPIHNFIRLFLVIAFHHISAPTFAGNNFQFPLDELVSVSASGWFTDGTKGSVDLVEVEASGTKMAAQEIGRLFNSVTRRSLNTPPDLRRIMSSYTLRMEFLAKKEAISMAIITAKILCVTKNDEAVYFELEDGFSSESFVTKLEQIFFGRKEGLWIRMREKTRHRNEF